MITGKGTIAVECMLITAPMTISSVEYKPGDLLVSDGESTWGMPYDRWSKKVKGARMDGIRKAAEALLTNGE